MNDMNDKLTSSDLEVIEEVKTAQAATGLGDDKFSKRHLTFSGSAWNRIKRGEYFDMVQKAQPVIDALRTDMGRYKIEVGLEERFNNVEPVQTEDSEVVKKMVEECKAKPLADPCRLVVFLAPTGGGKTFLCLSVRKSHKAIMIEAREAWKRSYYYCVRDICVAARVNVVDTNSPSTLEQRLLEKLAETPTLLAIDEAEFFGPQALNLVKLILNKTKTVILLCVIPIAYEKWNRMSSHEASQVRRRTHMVIRANTVDEDVVEKYLDGFEIAERPKVINEIRTAAESFGHYGSVRRFCNAIKRTKPKTLEKVRLCIVQEQVAQGLEIV